MQVLIYWRVYFAKCIFAKTHTMFQIGRTIVSEEIITEDFVCNLSACKGACCVDGEAGAPLEDGETQILLDIYPRVKGYLRPEGRAAIAEAQKEAQQEQQQAAADQAKAKH